AIEAPFAACVLCPGYEWTAYVHVSISLPSSPVQLRSAVWTGVTRDTRPLADLADRTPPRSSNYQGAREVICGWLGRGCGTVATYLLGPFHPWCQRRARQLRRHRRRGD